MIYEDEFTFTETFRIRIFNKLSINFTNVMANPPLTMFINLHFCITQNNLYKYTLKSSKDDPINQINW